MGAVRVNIRLTNAIDAKLANRGLLNPKLVRVYETQALVDTGASHLVIPRDVVQVLGLKIKGQQIGKYADGRQEKLGLTEPINIELMSLQTVETAFVAGDEVLIGQTVLETLALLVDCQNECLITTSGNSERSL